MISVDKTLFTPHCVFCIPYQL
ncbi:hypothetical protein CGRA01v4_08783 [Colletotrichum graminicola]|nr:hypothetical protein CGRA01v4_08783 [Colletotrichum graminicola]